MIYHRLLAVLLYLKESTVANAQSTSDTQVIDPCESVTHRNSNMPTAVAILVLNLLTYESV